jgi:hypothetical protein
MKTIGWLLVSLFSVAAMADFDSDLRAAMPSLTEGCIQKIFTRAERDCNRDSKNDEGRDHDCLLDDVSNIHAASGNTGSFALLYTVADADDYDYIVKISDVKHCTFAVSAEN